MRKVKNVTSKKILMLDALAWKARELGVSYGWLSTHVTPEEQELYYEQYTQIIKRRKELEYKRMEEFKKPKVSKKK